MKVILKADIKGVGKKDEVINASDGYARNFLFPKNLAVEANAENMSKLKAQKDSNQFKKDTEKEEAKKLAEKLTKIMTRIEVKAGENGKIFGGVSAKEIAESLEKQHSIKIDKKKIDLKETIKTLGMFSVDVKLYEGVLGKIKVDCWSGNMESFLNVFNSFKNVDVESKLLTESNFKGKDESFELIISNSENAIFTAKEIKDTGIAAIGTGALVGIASYGGAMMFAKASTGTAIKTLSGAAKKNATLAFFGGGSKALGGLGVKGGKFVLAGIVVTPILLVAGAITAARSKAKLAEAKKINAEAIDACEKMNVISTGMSGIENISKNYCTFIGNFNNIFNPIINKIQLIKDKYIVSENEKIDFGEITEEKIIKTTRDVLSKYTDISSVLAESLRNYSRS